jgi:hypothetical protein
MRRPGRLDYSGGNAHYLTVSKRGVERRLRKSTLFRWGQWRESGRQGHGGQKADSGR